MQDTRRYELVIEHIANARKETRRGHDYVAGMYIEWAREQLAKMSEGSRKVEAARALERYESGEGEAQSSLFGGGS